MCPKVHYLYLWLALLILPATLQGQITIGAGSDQGQEYPFDPYYGYTYSQSIYLSSEVGTAGAITALEWYFSGNNLNNAQDVTIWMAHVSRSSFTSTSDWEPLANLTQVYQGSPGTPSGAGWLPITLDQSFAYNGTDNLLIVVDENTPGYGSSSDDFYCSAVAGNRTIFYRNDNTNPDPASPPTGITDSNVPNVKLHIGSATCPEPSGAAISNLTATAGTLNWTENGSATTWELEWKAGADFTPGNSEEDHSATATTTPTQALSGLSANTSYYLYYRADCGSGDYSNWVGPYTFTTPCVAITTLSEDFDALSTPNLPDCWNTILENTSSSSYIRSSTNSSNSGSQSLQYFSSYDQSSDNLIAVLPMASNISAGTHRLNFFAKAGSNTAVDIEVGTITDPNDGSTFTSLQTVDLTTSFAQYSVSYAAYAGSDSYMAIRLKINSSTYNNVYIDDLIWEAIPVAAPNCSSPSIPADQATSVSISTGITWTSNLDATGYKLKIGTTAGGDEFLALTDVGNTTSYSLSANLDYGTTYYATLIPYNANGDATGCTSNAFTTLDGCRTASSPADGATGVSKTGSVTWSSLFGASGYQVSIGTTAGDTDILNAHDNGTSTSYDLSNVTLAYSTTYYVTIAAYNDQNNAAASCSSTSFTIENDPTVTAPWSDDFEAHATTTNSSISTNGWGSSPQGTTSAYRWDIDGSGSTPSSSTGPSGAYSGSNYLYTEASSGSTGSVATLTSPPIDVSGVTGVPHVEFYYHMYGISMGTLNVDIYDGTSWNDAVWTLSGQQQGSSSDAWLQASIDISSYTGSGTLQVRLRAVRGSNYEGDISIDDFTVRGLVADDVSITAITLPNSSCGLSANESATVTIRNEGASDIAIGAASVALTGALNSPAAVTNATLIAAGATEDITITNIDLSANQLYAMTATVTMAGDANSGNNTSLDSVENLTPIASFPYVQDFESGNGGWSAGGTNNSWALGTPATGDISSAASGANAWVTALATNYNNSEASYVASPCFDFSSTIAPQVSLAINVDTEFSYDGAVLQYSTDGGSTWTTVGSQGSGTNWYNDGTVSGISWASVDQDAWSQVSSGWLTAEHDLSMLAGESSVVFRIAFGSDGSGFQDGFAFDDFTITDITCPDPSAMGSRNVTASSAVLGWTENGAATAWELEWKTGADFTPGNGEEDHSATANENDSTSLTGLSANTAYYVYYRSACGGSDYSDWVGPVTFTTACIAVSAFIETFDGTSVPALPNCSQKVGASGTVTTTGSYSYAGGQSLYLYGSGATFAAPAVTNADSATHRLRFYARASASTSLKVGYLTDVNDAATFTEFTSVSISTAFNESVINMGAVPPAGAYLALQATSTSSVYVDNLTWEALPLTPPSCGSLTTPADSATNVALNISASWSNNIDATGYKLTLGTSSGATDVLNAKDLGTVTSFDLTDSLAFNTTYYATLIPYNNSGDASGCPETSFTTVEGCVTPFSPTNGSTTVNASTTLSWSSVTGAAGYQVNIGTTPGGTDVLSAHDNGSASTYALSGLSYSTTYYVTIKAYNAQGVTSAACTGYSFTTVPNPNFGGGNNGDDSNQPMSGGYYFANSTAGANGSPTQPAYNWIDPVANGHTIITSWTDDGAGGGDDSYFTVADLGFDFPFFGANYRLNSAHIGSNGFISFGVGNGSGGFFPNISIPENSGSGDINNFIAAALMDLDDGADGKVYYGGDTSKFVVTWWHYIDYGDASEYMTFQVILFSTGKIVIQYNDQESTADDGIGGESFLNDALVGIENAGGTEGIQYRRSGVGAPLFGSPLAVAFDTDATALPVELTHFTAKAVEAVNVLYWQTATEENNDRFEVQRATDGRTFVTIGQVEGAGMSHQPLSYDFTDAQPLPLTYYRLKQVDYDGNASYSPIVTVQRQTHHAHFSIYPNPVESQLSLAINLSTDQVATIQCFDLSGKLHHTQQQPLSAGYNRLDLSVEMLPAGWYLLKVQTKDGVFTERLLKK